ncbi:putative ferric-chelate reductase 1 [Clavelina lepadiformis]|uniref:putative ferric-chelate reductase 1 n=1 Tax=Clavelina lepadiformis TaxID=159417 RepID=UPI0040428563
MRKILFLCLVIFLKYSSAIDISGCGSTKTCVRSSDNCNPNNPTCLIFSFTQTSSGGFDMEISGGTGAGGQYVAVAFSPDGLMQNSDLYYCIGTELKSGVLQTRHSAPVTDPALPPQITGVTARTSNGVANCSFTRAANVSKNINSTHTRAFDLATSNYYVLLATAAYTGGSPSYHSTSRYSSGPYNFTASPSGGDTPTPSPDNPTTADCNVTKGCFFSPSSCTPGSSSCMFASWQYDSSLNTVTLNIIGGTTAGSQYAAIAFGTVDQMQDADLYYCTDSEMSTGVIRALRKQPADEARPPEIENIETGLTDGVVNCTFTRPASLTKAISGGVMVDFNLLTNTYYLLYAVGTTAGGVLQYHSSNRVLSGARINFTSVSPAAGGSSNDNTALIKAHASLMIIAWLTCASIGVIIARHFKPLWHDSTIADNKVWFQLHRGLMVIVLLATVAAFVLIFVAVGGYSENVGAHPILGIIVTGLTILNPIMALFRPHPNTPRRPIFNWAHWFVGSTARILAIAAIFLGVDLSRLNLPEWDTFVLVGFVVFHVIFEVVFEMISACYGHIDAYKKSKPEEYPMDGDDRKPDPPPKGTSIKYLLLIIYVIGNLAFLITFIYYIAVN